MNNDTARLGSASIFKATQATRQTLERCKSVEVQMVQDWAENRMLDFNLWAAGIGASSTSQSSLDKRLASQPAVRSVVLGLLSALKTMAQDCLDLGSGSTSSATPYLAQHSDEKDLDDSSSEQSDNFAPWSDNSDSEETGGQRQVSLLEQAVADTESVLSQLIRISKAIRAAGTVSRLRKAEENFNIEDYRHLEDEGYKQSPKVDIEGLRALKAHLMTLLFTQRSKAVAELGSATRGPWRFKTDFGDLQEAHRSIIDQLCFANLLRRNRFSYAKRHAKKLAASAETHDEGDHRASAEGIVKDDSATRPTGQVTSSDQAPKGATINLPRLDLRQQVLMSETTPSEGTLDARALQKAGDSEVALSRKSVSLDKSGWPHPPALARNRASFRCPCCHQTLPSEESKQLLWRKHLSSDLYPFTCLFPGCSRGVSLFISRSEWKAHMQQEHRSTTYWECFACTDAETSAIFENAEDFISHMNSEHGNVANKEDFPRLLRVCQRTKPLTIEACPLCVVKPQDDDLDPKALLDHIADHIHDFSLASLPWADEPPRTMARPQRQVLQKVSNWLDDKPMDYRRDPEEGSPPSSVIRPDYFAESGGGSSRVNISSPTHSNMSLEPMPNAEETRQERLTVVIIVSTPEKGSVVLEQLQQRPNFSAVKLLVLIYAPSLQGHTDIETALLEDLPFKQLYQLALDLVEHETMVIPFTTTRGHWHIIRVLDPFLTYLEESLLGDEGDIVSTFKTWPDDLMIIHNIPGATPISGEAYSRLLELQDDQDLRIIGHLKLEDLSGNWSSLVLTMK